MREKSTIDRRQAIKLGILGAVPFRPGNIINESQSAESIQITQAMTPAVKKGYQVVDGNEEEFTDLLLTVKNTGDSPITISRQLANDYPVGYVLSGVPYPATDWKNKAIGWGDEVAPGETVEITIHGANKANYGPLQFNWDMEKKVLRRIPNQFRPEQRTFPDDYAQGETYTAKFGFFIEGADGDKIPVTDSVTLQYSGGMKKFHEFNSVSYWVPYHVESVEGSTQEGQQSSTSSQTDPSGEEDETPTPADTSERTAQDITVKILNVQAAPVAARVVAAVLDFGGYDELKVGACIDGGRYNASTDNHAGTVTPEQLGFIPTFSKHTNMPLRFNREYTVQAFAITPDGARVWSKKETFTTPKRSRQSDQDGDNLQRTPEIQVGADPNDPDTDGDGWTDGEEFVAGTDPINPDDHP